MAIKVTAKKKFWAFKVLADNEGELTIYGEIADSQEGWFSDGNEVTPTSFKAELDALGDITTLNVYMKSPGGDVFVGQTIYSQLKRHKSLSKRANLPHDFVLCAIIEKSKNLQWVGETYEV